MARDSRLETVKRKAKVRSLERKERLAAWNDYIGFATAKAVGFACSGVGALELLQPDILGIVLSNPGSVAGFGVALLTGPKTVNTLAKVMNALKQ